MGLIRREAKNTTGLCARHSRKGFVHLQPPFIDLISQHPWTQGLCAFFFCNHSAPEWMAWGRMLRPFERLLRRQVQRARQRPHREREREREHASNAINAWMSKIMAMEGTGIVDSTTFGNDHPRQKCY